MHVDEGVGHPRGKFHLVGHQDHGHSAFSQGLDHPQHLAGELRIQGRCHLVEQHHLGLHGQRAGNRHPLLLATRQLLGIGLRLVGQAHLLQRAGGDLARLVCRHVLHGLGCEGDVLFHRQVREQVVALEHNAHVLAQLAQVHVGRMHRMAADLDGAAVDDLQPVYASQCGAFARTAFANDGHHLAFRNGKGHAFEHLVAAEALVHVLEFHNGVYSGVHDGVHGVFLLHVAFAEGAAGRMPNCGRCSSLRLQTDSG